MIKKIIVKYVLCVLVFGLVMFGMVCVQVQNLVIGGKNFIEQLLFLDMIV